MGESITRSEIQSMLTEALTARDKLWQTKVDELKARVLQLETEIRGEGKVVFAKGTAPKRPVKNNGRRCFCCDGTTAVHRHRDLGVPLDDKCRKQVETFKQGGVLTERRELWGDALKKILPNARAREMLVFLEGEDTVNRDDQREKRRKKSRSQVQTETQSIASQPKVCQPKTCPEDQCTICQDYLHAYSGTKLISLPCEHSFHRDCILPWLQERPTCPVCRTNVRLEFPSDASGDVRVVAADTYSCGPSVCDDATRSSCVVSPTLCGSSSGCFSTCTDTNPAPGLSVPCANVCTLSNPPARLPACGDMFRPSTTRLPCGASAHRSAPETATEAGAGGASAAPVGNNALHIPSGTQELQLFSDSVEANKAASGSVVPASLDSFRLPVQASHCEQQMEMDPDQDLDLSLLDKSLSFGSVDVAHDDFNNFSALFAD